MLKDLKNHIFDSNFKVTILKNKISILNYLEIDHFDDVKIIIRYKEGVIVVNGKELIISKLLDDEILINGKIKTVEFK